MNGSNNTPSQGVSGKKRIGRFNFIDFTLILIAVILIGALIYMFSPISLIKNWANRETIDIRYEVEFTNVDEAFINKISSGDAVIDSVSKNSVGIVSGDIDYNTKYSELEAVKVEVSEENSEALASPEYTGIMVEYPDKYNVRVTISATAKDTEGYGYTVNSVRIAVGEKMSLKFPSYVGEGYCIDVIEY